MMQDPTQPDLQPEEPICVCGYPKSGLPTIESPCPECGSTVLAVYKRSLSYIGWRLGVVAGLIALLHIPVAATFFSILEQVHKNPVIESIGRFLWKFGITAESIFVAPWLVMAITSHGATKMLSAVMPNFHRNRPIDSITGFLWTCSRIEKKVAATGICSKAIKPATTPNLQPM